jgi:hypothetical protein
MNLLDLRGAARIRLEDTVGPPYLWDDNEIDSYINQAEREACERALLIEDDTPPSVPVAVTGITQAGGLATATIPTHPFTPGQVVHFAGVSPAAYGGDFRVSVPDPDHVCYFVPAATPPLAIGLAITAQAALGTLTNINGLALVGTYPLDGRIIEVRSALWQGRFLEGIARETLNDPDKMPNRYSSSIYLRSYFAWPYWDGNRDWSTAIGSPRFFIDPQEAYLTLVRIPPTAAPIHLSLYRYPLAPMVAPNVTLDPNAVVPSPEIVERHHFRLLDWVERCAYLKKDSECFDQKEADDAEKRFIASFGIRHDANVRRQQRARRSNQVRMNPAW